MSFCAYIVKVDHSGDKIAQLFESELAEQQALYDAFKEYFVIKPETWYHTDDVRDKIAEQYTVSMSNYYVSEDGYKVWVQELDEPIVTPLSEIKSEVENLYTLYGITQSGIHESARYNSWVRKNNKQYIVTLDDWAKALSYFPKNHHIHEYADKGFIIVNSY
jgi:hypothetical protein